MRRAIETRLIRLESKAAHRLSKQSEINEYLLQLAVTQHFGDPQLGEWLLASYPRALGYTVDEYILALARKIASRPTDLDQRQDQANRRLFEKFGATSNSVSSETLQRIEASLWPDYKEDLLEVARHIEEGMPRDSRRMPVLRSRPA